ncbi:MAG: rRNA cytosine-C5-methyltransferase [Mucinivorans sp.]
MNIPQRTSEGLPTDFVAAHSAELCRAIVENEAITSIRLNPQKPYNHNLTDKVEWTDDGYYLARRPVFTLDPVFAAGGYYVQEASSMAVGWIAERLDLPEKPKVLDLCAAPGGKSTHLSSIIGHSGVLVANETIRSRAGILCQNIEKWGVGNTIVTSADAAAMGNLGATFDLIVVDAPCSGEGMFRKDITAREEWSLDNVARCAARQRRILGDVWDALVQDGYMIYSTCTFNADENEKNVAWIARELGAEIMDMGEIPGGATQNAVAGYNFYPNLVRGEGFYVAVLRKTSPAPYRAIKMPRLAPRTSDKYSRDPLYVVDRGDSLYGYTSDVYTMVEILRSARIFMLTAGVDFGTKIREQLKPAHSLALYAGLRDDIFPRSEVPLTVALNYLRKEAIDASAFVDGLNLVTYNSLPLGFVKRIGARVNNMYPIGWRIATL